MHEFSIAREMMNHILREINRYKVRRIKEVYIEIGDMTMINTEQLVFALHSIATGSIAEGMRINIKRIPLKIRCKNNHVNEISYNEDEPFSFLIDLRCPDCDGGVSIEGGNECIIKKIVAE